MVVASWIDRAVYPFESKWFPVGTKRVHYVDEGVGEPILFLHGSPGWSFSFRHLIRGLSSQKRCIAPDLIGFGLSDKPTNWTYRPERDAEYIRDFIESKNLNGVTLVLHGMGGPIGLAYAVDNPRNVKRIVIINSWMWPLSDFEGVKKQDRLVNGFWGRFAYFKMNVAVRSLKSQMVDRSHFAKLDFEHYWNPFDEVSERVGPYGYAKAMLGSTHFFKGLWEKRSAIQNIPALIFWGMEDRLLGHTTALQEWNIVFPDAEVKRLANTGPFVMEEKGAGLVPPIEMFVNDQAYLPTATLV